MLATAAAGCSTETAPASDAGADAATSDGGGALDTGALAEGIKARRQPCARLLPAQSFHRRTHLPDDAPHGANAAVGVFHLRVGSLNPG